MFDTYYGNSFPGSFEKRKALFELTDSNPEIVDGRQLSKIETVQRKLAIKMKERCRLVHTPDCTLHENLVLDTKHPSKLPAMPNSCGKYKAR